MRQPFLTTGRSRPGRRADIDPARTAAAIAVNGTFGYRGTLLGPVVIGLLADATNLGGALLLAVALSLAIAAGGRLRPQWRVRGHDAPPRKTVGVDGPA